MNWINTNLLISICTCAIGLTQFFFWRHIAKQKSYESEKGKNLAMKEDIGEIIKEIKTIESKFINETEILKNNLTMLANVQTNIESIKRNSITDFNKTIFTFMYFIIKGNISNETDNEALDEYLQILNNHSDQSFTDQVLLDLFIEDKTLRKEANEVLINVLKMNRIKHEDILELKNINDKITEVKNKYNDTTTKRNILLKMTDERRSYIKKMYDKQIKEYNEIKEQIWDFQDICRTQIYQLINKPEH